jgi:hypothetical protein
MDDVRGPRFFLSKVDDESVEEQSEQQEPVFTYPKRGSNPSSGPESELSENQPAPSLEDVQNETSDVKNQAGVVFGPKAESSAIKVENQSQPEGREVQHTPGLGAAVRYTTILTQPGEPQIPSNINSPGSEGQSFEFCKIQTGAHSLSSTDSDMTKTIRTVNKDILESPPNVISPTSEIENIVIPSNIDEHHLPEHV